jgi:hypothetical protein
MELPEGHPLHAIAISQLPPADSVGLDDLVVIVQNSTTKRATVRQVLAAVTGK